VGLRRFDLTNLISIAAIVLEFGGIVGLVAVGKGWFTWQLGTPWLPPEQRTLRMPRSPGLNPCFVCARAASSGTRYPEHSVQPGQPIRRGRPQLSLQAPPIVIGLVLGSSSVVPFHIGRRIPQMISALYMRASAVFFPAVSEHAQGRNRASIREILEVGTRWVVVWALPVCMVLWILAPELLQAWISNVSRAPS